MDSGNIIDTVQWVCIIWLVYQNQKTYSRDVSIMKSVNKMLDLFQSLSKGK